MTPDDSVHGFCLSVMSRAQQLADGAAWREVGTSPKPCSIARAGGWSGTGLMVCTPTPGRAARPVQALSAWSECSDRPYR
jgi:hypothetical protein